MTLGSAHDRIDHKAIGDPTLGRMVAEEHHDIVIIGGGAAGVSAALECFDIRLDVVLVEAGPALGGQLAEVPNSIRNLAAGRFENGEALRRGLEESAAIIADRVHLSHPVTSADLGDRWVEANGRRFQASALLVASGSTKQRLRAAVDGAFGGDITYKIESQPGRFDGRPVVVIGGGDSATLDALELARAGSTVKLVHRSDTLTARRDIVEKLRAEPAIEDLPGWDLDAALGKDRLEAVTIVRPATGERRTLLVGGLIVKIARLPLTDLFEGQLELDRRGAVVVDGELRTSQAGVFAAGDVVSGSYPRVASALGQGVLAARSLLRYLESRP
jgi:thioredoxin reductase (NADPH)